MANSVAAVLVLLGLRGLLEPDPPTVTASMTVLASESMGTGVDPETDVDAPRLALSTAIATVEVGPFVAKQVVRERGLDWSVDEIRRNIQIQGGETASFVDIAVVTPDPDLSLDITQGIQDRLMKVAESRIELLSAGADVDLVHVTVVHSPQMLPLPDPRLSFAVYCGATLVLSLSAGVLGCVGMSRASKGLPMAGSRTKS